MRAGGLEGQAMSRSLVKGQPLCDGGLIRVGASTGLAACYNHGFSVFGAAEVLNMTIGHRSCKVVALRIMRLL